MCLSNTTVINQTLQLFVSVSSGHDVINICHYVPLNILSYLLFASPCLPVYHITGTFVDLSSHIIPITSHPLKHIYVYQSVQFELSLVHTTLHQMLRLRMPGAISPHPTCLHGIMLS